MGSLMSSVAVAVRRFARASNRRVWCGRLLQGLALAAALLAALALVARVLGCYLAPSCWWSLAALPALGWACWRLRREALTAALAAVHLDRRLQLDGLLLTVAAGRGGLGPAFAGRVAAALPHGRAVLPALRWRAVLPGPLLAGAVLSLIAMMPPPPPPSVIAPMPAVQLAVERLGEQLDRLERGHLPDDTEDELEQKLEQLYRQLEEGVVPEWSELDRLDARLERESLLQQLGREELARAAAALQMPGLDPTSSAQAIAAAAQALASAGLLQEVGRALDDEQQQALAAAMDGSGSFDAAALGLDPAALAALAEAMARYAGQMGASGGAAGVLDPAARQRLAELLAQRPVAGHVHGPECAGGG